jgi:hypothetical protein
MEYVILIIGLLICLYIIGLPVKIAAAAMGAQRTGMFWCLLALVGSSILHAIGATVPCIGTVIAFILSALAFSAILGTGFFGGIGIEILTIIFSAILVIILTLVFGVSLTEIIPYLMDLGKPVSF